MTVSIDGKPGTTELGRPLLIGITGSRGSGKTALLARLLDYLRRDGRAVDGLLAEAEGRPSQGRGAERYVLRWPLHNRESPLCERIGQGDPPYRFSDQAWHQVAAWAEGLASQTPRPDVIVLDEFGQLEARGEGFARHWDSIVRAEPAIVVVALRQEASERISTHLGQPFDLIVEAGAPRTLERLCELCAAARDWQRIGRYGAAAGGIEITLGSLLHGTKVPFRRVVMASLQSVTLFFAGEKLARPTRLIWVSYLAASLKALSPAGNRLRPMTAIAMQGTLFSTSVRLLGWNTIGVTAGAWLVGAWAALQGVLLQYLLLGESLLNAYGEVQEWFTRTLGWRIPSLPLTVAVYVAAAGSASVGIVTWARYRRRPPALLAKALTRDIHGKTLIHALPWWRRLLREYKSRAFWLPLIVVLLLLVASGARPPEIAGLILRAFGIVALLFIAIAFIKPGQWAHRLQSRGMWGPAVALSRAMLPVIPARSNGRR